jgi:tetratricopeptide (TPR) repeat protein
VASVRREPTPPGPISDLFARLDDLHSRAGRPSMREIALRAGRGNVSSSTVHNVFRGSRVPSWNHLEKIVTALGGASDLDEFHGLWDTAWRAADEAKALRGDLAGPVSTAPSTGRAGYQPESPLRPVHPVVPRSRASDWADSTPRRVQRIWSNEIPSRNVNFSGRSAELEMLSRNLASQSPRVQVITGMGGIGKTELATEYIYRNIGKYQIVWWIRAEHHDRVREALVTLARRLEPRPVSADNSRARTIEAVLTRLHSEPEPSWLLVYDNVVDPFDLQKYLPASRAAGHVIVTSRELSWPGHVIDRVEVAPFPEVEAVSYLRHRVPRLASPGADESRLTAKEDTRRAGDAARLAKELGYLPIAIEHAAAYLSQQTECSVDEYLTRFAQNAHQLLSEQRFKDSDLPHAQVSGTWALSNELLTSDAKHLFNLCAFFSPEPIAVGLFLQDTTGIEDPPGVAEFLSSAQRFRAAASQLHRLSLAKFDGARNLIQMHRVVQEVTQGRLRNDNAADFHAYRAAVDTLLATSNPGNPDNSDGDATYDLSLQHLESDHRFLHTSNPALRDLIIDQVRRLHLRGAHVEAAQFGQDALRMWRDLHGEDDLKALTMAVEVAVAMYMGGRVADAHDLIRQTRELLKRYEDGDGFKAFLLCESIYGADLRARSQFREALELDLAVLPKCEITFGETHERTLNTSSNIAVDYRQLGQFAKALDMDQRTLEGRRRILGHNHPISLFSYSAVARDLRGLGQYQDSLDIARRIVSTFESIGGRENRYWLNASEAFATALRKAGYYWEARQESEHALQRCREYLGDDHMFTLKVATNLVNDRRSVGDHPGAEELAHETCELCRTSSAPDELLCVAQLNLASVLRATGDPAARGYDDQARRGLIRIYGDRHPFTLAANVNYAADLAGCGNLGEAIQIGDATLDKCRDSLGETHPDTLMAAANLSIDELTAGNKAMARRRLADVLDKYETTLTMEHPEARQAAQGKRITAEIESLVS